MRRYLVLVAALGCHHAYQADVTALGEGRYMIRAAPDEEQVSESIATQYAHRRAREVCPTGYELVDGKSGTVRSTERVAVFGRRTNEMPEVTLVVRCR